MLLLGLSALAVHFVFAFRAPRGGTKPTDRYLGNLFTHTSQAKMAPQRNIRASHEEFDFVKMLLCFSNANSHRQRFEEDCMHHHLVDLYLRTSVFTSKKLQSG